jgi:hypothetical protein
MNLKDIITNPLFVSVFSVILTLIITVFFTKWLRKIRDNAIKAINTPFKISLKQIFGYILIAFNICSIAYLIILIIRSDKPISKMEILYINLAIGELIVLFALSLSLKLLSMSIESLIIIYDRFTEQNEINMRQNELNKLLADAIKDTAESGKGMNKEILKLLESISLPSSPQSSI